MQLQIRPSIRDIATRRVWTIEPQDDKTLLHHLLRLERNREFGVFVRDRFGGVGLPEGVGRGGEDGYGLGFLHTGYYDVAKEMM